MDQKTVLAMAAMLNSFPQGSNDLDLTLRTFQSILGNLSSQAITETAQRFAAGEVQGQSLKFAPSVAEFTQEARRIESLLPYRNQPQITFRRDSYEPLPEDEDARMRLKMPLWSEAMKRGQIERLATALASGLDHVVALAQEWEVAIPEGVWTQLERKAPQHRKAA